MSAAEIIKKYLGVPFKNAGRTLEGLDCYGLVMAIYADEGYTLFDLDRVYDNRWFLKGENYMLENYYKEWREVKEPKFLDLVGFKNSRNITNHVGVMLTERKFIHTSRAGTCVSPLLPMTKNVSGFYRFKDLDE